MTMGFSNNDHTDHGVQVLESVFHVYSTQSLFKDYR